MRLAVSIILGLAFGADALAQPVCNPSVPTSMQCFSQAISPLASDIVGGVQAIGPQRANQSVKYSLSQITAGGFPGSFSTLAASGAASFTASGTALSVTNNATIGGVATVGEAPKNIITLTPGATTSNSAQIASSGGGAPLTLVSGTGTTNIGVLGAHALQARTFTSGNQVQTLSGSSVGTPAAVLNLQLAGTSTSPSNLPITTGILTGAVADTLLSNGGASVYLQFIRYQNSGAIEGSRAGLKIQMQLAAATNFSAIDTGLQGTNITVAGSANAGGSGPGSLSRGTLFGAVLDTRLDAAATWWHSVVGLEIDNTVNASANVNYNVGQQIVHQAAHATQGVNADIAFLISDQETALVGWKNAMVVGNWNSKWPVDPNGYIYQTQIGITSNTATAAGGIDLVTTDFSGSGVMSGGFAFRADGVSLIPGSANGGAVWAGAGVFSGTASGASLDVNLHQLSGTPTVADGGTGWTTGQLAAGPGGVVKVTAAAGVVTSVTVLKRFWVSGSAPATGVFEPVQYSGTKPTADITLNLSWTSNTGLEVQGSGGATTYGGSVSLKDLTVGTLPTCNGGAKYQTYVVSDANAPTYGATLAGGGAVTAIALCDGTNWTAH